MREQSNWSISLGRYWGVHVQLHLFFLLFASFSLYLSWLEETRSGQSFVQITAGSLGLLFLSVLLHELGHWIVLRRLGERPTGITLGPLGGLQPLAVRLKPSQEFVAHLAGPAVNLALVIAAAFALHVQQPYSWSGLLHPLQPAGMLTGTPGIVSLKLMVWINTILLAANLLPAYPFDGARLLQSGLLWARPQMSRNVAARHVASVAKLAAVAVGGVACLMWRAESVPGLIAPWFALLILAIFLFFSAKQERSRVGRGLPTRRRDGSDSGPPGSLTPRAERGFASPGVTPISHHNPFEEQTRSDEPATSESLAPDSMLPESLLEDNEWLDNQRKRLIERREQMEAAEESQVDEILIRVHERGIASLSDEDRQILDRVSARYRKRQQALPE